MISEIQRRQQGRKLLRGVGYLVLSPHVALGVRLLDVSVDGLGVVAAANLAGGTTGTLRFSVPDGHAGRQSFEIGVVVLHSILSGEDDGFRVGMRFEPGLPAAVRSAVEGYINA